MKTLLITGGSSEIGRAVAEKLKTEFQLCFLTHTKPVFVPGVETTSLPGGLAGVADHQEQVRSADLILHMAGLTHTNSQEAYFEVNHEGTRQLLSVCRPGQPVVYLSTRCAGVTGGAYGYSKLLAEDAILASGQPATIIRPSEVYGSKSREGIDTLLYLAARFHVLIDFRHNPPVTYSPVSTEELAAFIADVVRAPHHENKIYTICNDAAYTARDIQTAFQRGSGQRLIRLPVPVGLLRTLLSLHLPMPFKRDQLARLVMQKTSDNRSAREDFGFAPQSFLEVLDSRGPAV